jgi:poly-gamma-glutamate synthesis protein (capsule biosynthesis protein)
VRVAFIGYASVLLPQYWATAERPGAAPMRAHTFYEPYEFQPGAPARVVTVPHAEDFNHLVNDIRAVREHADLVLVSLHWGLHFTPRPCDYQPLVAHAAIDAGADAVLGHHPHQPQSVERYKHGVIFYSIGNFSFFIRGDKQRQSQHSHVAPGGEYTHQEIYSLEPDPGFSFDYRRHSNEGGIVFLEADRSGLLEATYLPTLMDETGRARVVTPDQAQFQKSLEYLNWTGKFVANGAADIRAGGERYLVYTRGG